MPQRTNHTNALVLAALMTALAAVLAQIQIPLPVVPISMASLAVLLCGALLPPRFAAFSMATYVFLGAIGVPVYAGFAAGPSVLFGPTGGFFFGFMLCAPVVSQMLRRMGFSLRTLHICMTAGTLLCYLPGTAWFMAVTGTGLAASLTACVFPFLPGDAVKIALAAMLAMRLKKTGLLT